MAEDTALMTPEFIERIKQFKADMFEATKRISGEKTPIFDRSGRQVVRRRPDGKDYIEDTYMRIRLDKHFPGWSWEMSAPLHFLGAEWVVAQGHLLILDEHLLAFGIVPPTRKFYGVDAVRIQYKSGLPHGLGNIIDVGDNAQAANTGALKRAINRLTRIGDDIYGKRVEEEGISSIEEAMEGSVKISTDTKAKLFENFRKTHRLLYSDIHKIIGTTDIAGFGYDKAIEKIKEAKDIE